MRATTVVALLCLLSLSATSAFAFSPTSGLARLGGHSKFACKGRASAACIAPQRQVRTNTHPVRGILAPSCPVRPSTWRHFEPGPCNLMPECVIAPIYYIFYCARADGQNAPIPSASPSRTGGGWTRKQAWGAAGPPRRKKTCAVKKMRHTKKTSLPSLCRALCAP